MYPHRRSSEIRTVKSWTAKDEQGYLQGAREQVKRQNAKGKSEVADSVEALLFQSRVFSMTFNACASVLVLTLPFDLLLAF